VIDEQTENSEKRKHIPEMFVYRLNLFTGVVKKNEKNERGGHYWLGLLIQSRLHH